MSYFSSKENTPDTDTTADHVRQDIHDIRGTVRNKILVNFIADAISGCGEYAIQDHHNYPVFRMKLIGKP